MVDNIGTSTRDNGLISSSMSKVGPTARACKKSGRQFVGSELEEEFWNVWVSTNTRQAKAS